MPHIENEALRTSRSYRFDRRKQPTGRREQIITIYYAEYRASVLRTPLSVHFFAACIEDSIERSDRMNKDPHLSPTIAARIGSVSSHMARWRTYRVLCVRNTYEVLRMDNTYGVLRSIHMYTGERITQPGSGALNR